MTRSSQIVSPHRLSLRWVSNPLWCIALWCSLACFVGCAGYQLGTRTLYRNDIRTIAIPVVRSDTFRPDLGVRLTEAIQKLVEERTPYKIVDESTADSILNCRITSDSKVVITETRDDDPRALKGVITVDTSWVDRRGFVLMENRFLPPGEVTFFFAQGNDFVPEGGQSITTSYQRNIERLAEHIVGQMEMRW